MNRPQVSLQSLPYPKEFLNLNDYTDYLIEPTKFQFPPCKYQQKIKMWKNYIDIEEMKYELEKGMAQAVKHRKKKAKQGYVGKEGSLLRYEKIVIVLMLIDNLDWCRNISITDIAYNLYHYLARKPTYIRDKIQQPSWITRDLCKIPPDTKIPGEIQPEKYEKHENPADKLQEDQQDNAESDLIESSEKCISSIDSRLKLKQQRKSLKIRGILNDIEEQQGLKECDQSYMLEAVRKFKEKEARNYIKNVEEIRGNCLQLVEFSFAEVKEESKLLIDELNESQKGKYSKIQKLKQAETVERYALIIQKQEKSSSSAVIDEGLRRNEELLRGNKK